jgi:hypothetical protein
MTQTRLPACQYKPYLNPIYVHFPDVFYEHVREVAVELGLDPALLGDVRSWLKVYEGQGVGYAK